MAGNRLRLRVLLSALALAVGLLGTAATEAHGRTDWDGSLDLWPVFRGLKGRPTLVVHGAISDLLSAESVAKMTAEIPEMASVTVPDVGHAPTLDEPEARAAIDALLARVIGK